MKHKITIDNWISIEVILNNASFDFSFWTFEIVIVFRNHPRIIFLKFLLHQFSVVFSNNALYIGNQFIQFFDSENAFLKKNRHHMIHVYEMSLKACRMCKIWPCSCEPILVCRHCKSEICYCKPVCMACLNDKCYCEQILCVVCKKSKEQCEGHFEKMKRCRTCNKIPCCERGDCYRDAYL